MNPFSNPKSVCLVHDWLITVRGGEKVLESIAELYPEAPIYTLFCDRSRLSSALAARDIRTSFLQWIPGITNYYRWLLPLFPPAIRSFDLNAYDLVISSSHCVAKAVRKGPGAKHICYCHTPMRYLWGFEEEYLSRFPGFVRKLIGIYFCWLKTWDRRTAASVDLFIANSRTTAERIHQYYGRQAEVVHPPVESPPSNKPCPGKYFLLVSALVPYKRVEMAIEAFNRNGHPLQIVGEGPMRSRLEAMVRSPSIQFQGWVDRAALWQWYQNAIALIFPGEEDFGIVPVEMQMCGKPVIAYGRGGIRDSVLAANDPEHPRPRQESTGLFFYEPTADGLCQQIDEFDPHDFSAPFIRRHAETFNPERFKAEFSQKALFGRQFQHHG